MSDTPRDINWFLDVYVPTVLKPMPGWGITSPGLIRRYSGVLRRWPSIPRCPLTAEAGCPPGHWAEEGARLGLSRMAAQSIANAADAAWTLDTDTATRTVRARLLAGLGLTEPSE